MREAVGVSGVESSRVSARPLWWWAVLAAAVISLPSLFAGFYGDDLVQRLVLEGRLPSYELGVFGLYDFTPPRLAITSSIDAGNFPWFTSAELSLRFLRPLSSASLALDHFLFGRNAVLAHLQSSFWMLLLAAAAASLYERWFARGPALLSALVFALSTVHGAPTAWLASRHTLLAASLAVLALWAWVKYREDGLRAGALLAPASLIGSLLASESGLVGVLLCGCYELASRGWRRGLAGASVLSSVGLAYLLVYTGLGYGTRGSSFYVSPFSAPIEYLGIALWSVPALCVELLLGVPSAAAAFLPEARVPFVFAGLAASAAVCAIVFARRSELSPAVRRTLSWLGAGACVGLIVLVGAPVTGRVLPLPAFGAAALVGHALWLVWQRARAKIDDRPASARRGFNASWLAFATLGSLHFGLSPLLRVGAAFQFRQMSDDQRRLAEQADVGTCGERGTLYLLTGADPILALYTAAALRFHTPTKGGAERLRVLSMAPQPLRLERSGPTTLSLQVLDLPRRQNPFERLYRPPHDPLLAGTRLALSEVTVEVEAADTGVYDRVRFDFSEPLERIPACFLVWQGGRLRALSLPRVGENVRLDHELGPLGM